MGVIDLKTSLSSHMWLILTKPKCAMYFTRLFNKGSWFELQTPLLHIFPIILNWPNRQDFGLTSKDFASLMEQVLQFNRVGTVKENSAKIRFY